MKNSFAKKFVVCALAGVLGFALTACGDSSSAGGDNGSGGNRGGIPDTVETFMELSDYDCGKSQKCVATYLTEYHDMAVCDGDNGWVIGTLIEKMNCDFSSSSAKVTDKVGEPAEGSSSSVESSDSKSSSSVKSGDSSSSSSADKLESSSSKGDVPKSYAEAKVMPSGTYDCSKYNCFTTEYLNQEFLEAGKYGEILDERDGQVYKTVQIGEQIWMAENMNFDYNYNDFHGENFGSKCYKNSADSCAKYGRLYTWAGAMDSVKTGCGRGWKCAADTGRVQGVCPNGWHLPDTAEWNVLIDAVGGVSTAGTMLKTTEGWQIDAYRSMDVIGTDAFGFSALPSGAKETGGYFYYAGQYSHFWSSSEYMGDNAYIMKMTYYTALATWSYRTKYFGHAVRCIKDSE